MCTVRGNKASIIPLPVTFSLLVSWPIICQFSGEWARFALITPLLQEPRWSAQSVPYNILRPRTPGGTLSGRDSRNALSPLFTRHHGDRFWVHQRLPRLAPRTSELPTTQHLSALLSWYNLCRASFRQSCRTLSPILEKKSYSMLLKWKTVGSFEVKTRLL